MALIVNHLLETGPFLLMAEGVRREVKANICVELKKSILSEPYKLHDGTTILGEILKIERLKREFTDEEYELIEREIIGKKAEFMLWVPDWGNVDVLYLSESSWFSLRDLGIFPAEHIIRVKLTEAKYEGKTVEIFPERDIIEN